MSETLHIYTRVSSAAQEEDGTSLVTQREQGERKAKELGMIAKVWNEGAQSSRHEDLVNRPVLQGLLELIDSGDAKHIWVYAPDRLSRNDTIWALIRLKLAKQNVELYTSTGKYSLSSATDKFTFGIMAEVSAFENFQRAKRSKEGKLKRISQGYWMGGPPPYGYKVEGKKLVINKTEAKWVNFIFQSYHDGKTINQIRTLLLENQVVTRRGKNIWSLGSIEALLTNSHYSGTYSVQSIRCECESIVPTTLFRNVADARKKRSKRRIRESNQKHFYLLRDFLACSHCGSHFSGRHYPKQPARSVYYCPRKERNYVNKGTDKEIKCSNSRYLKIRETDELVWDTVFNVLLKSPLFKSETKEDIHSRKRSEEQYVQEGSRMKKQLVQIEREIREHGETISRVEALKLLNAKTPDQVAEIRKTIEQQLASLKAKRDALIAKIQTHQSDEDWDDWVYKHEVLLEHLADLSPEQQIVVLRHVVKSISVETIDTRSHRLTINFKLPYYGGDSNHIDPKKPSKGHTITGGKDVLEVTLTNAKKNT